MMNSTPCNRLEMLRSVTWGAGYMELFGFTCVATIAAISLATAGIWASNAMDAFFSLFDDVE